MKYIYKIPLHLDPLFQNCLTIDFNNHSNHNFIEGYIMGTTTSKMTFWTKMQTLRLKLPLLVIFTVAISAACIALCSIFISKEFFEKEASSKLESITASKHDEIETYLGNIKEDLTLIADNETTYEAVIDFQIAWNLLKQTGQDPNSYLKKHYIDENLHPSGEKNKLNYAHDGSQYSKIHKKHHPWLNQLLKTRGYYDIFLTDIDGNVVYTSYKEQDFATNLITGPWKDTDLATAYEFSINHPDDIYFSDFAPYSPSSGAPASFMAAAVKGPLGDPVGIVAFQMPIDRINEVMQSQIGLGETGELFIIGEDNFLRSQPRLETEPAILKLKISGNNFSNSQDGTVQVTTSTNYRGKTVVAAHEKISFSGIDWIIVGEQALEEIYHPSTMMKSYILMVSAATLVLATLIGFLFSGRLTKPILAITETMKELSNGKLETDVPSAERQDEIGDMARSVKVFQENALQMQRLEEKSRLDEERQAEQRREMLHNLADELNQTVATIAGSLIDASGQMSSSATSLTQSSEEATQCTTTVNASTSEAAHSVSTVLAASEQLSAAIQEISEQTAQSTQAANSAVEQAQNATSQMARLTEASEKIGDFAKIISDISSQTNLLALNATIEAASAGEAGKGFAVVASEVRNLAEQTSKATDQITRQIHLINTESSQANEAMQSVDQAILNLNQVATRIACAVEEQDAATREITRSIQHVSENTTEVERNVEHLKNAAEDTGKSAITVQTAAEKMSQQSNALSHEVDRFIQNIRQA